MAGIRLMHEKERGCIVAVVHPSRKLRAPILCEQCHEVHATKTVHLILDDDGATIVSPEVLKLLKEAGMPSLRIESEVADPPAQVVRLEGPPGQFTATTHTYGGRWKRLYVLRNKLARSTDG